MADVTIGGLPPASLPLNGKELLELEQAGASGKAVLDALFPPNFITDNGLHLQWVSGNSLAISSGAAHIPGLGYVVRVTSTIAVVGLSLSASTWYHVYLFENGSGNGGIEIVTTVPASPYSGTARTKTGDTSRRYIGSILSDASGAIIRFYHDSLTGEVQYLNNTSAAPNRLLAAATATTKTVVSIASMVPLTAYKTQYHVQNTSTTAATVILDIPETGLAGTSGLRSLGFGGNNYMDLPTISLQMSYIFAAAPTGGGIFLDVVSYNYQR